MAPSRDVDAPSLSQLVEGPSCSTIGCELRWEGPLEAAYPIWLDTVVAALGHIARPLGAIAAPHHSLVELFISTTVVRLPEEASPLFRP